MNADNPSNLEQPRRELAAIIARLAQAPGRHGTAWAPLVFHRREAPTEANPCFYEPALALVAQGAKEVLLGQEAYGYDENHFLLTAVDLPVTSRVTRASPGRPYLSFSLRIDLGQVGELIAQGPGSPPPAGPGHRGLAVNQVTPPLLDAALRLARLLLSPGDLPALAPLIEREILYRLLTGPAGARLRQLATQDSSSQQIAQAIHWLKRNFQQPLRLEALALETNMSLSSLHHHFKAITAMSPLQFQKQLRLQEARRLMLTGADAADAGFQVGYESPSHFSRDYRRLYGAPPQRDVAGLRRRLEAS